MTVGNILKSIINRVSTLVKNELMLVAGFRWLLELLAGLADFFLKFFLTKYGSRPTVLALY